MSAPASRVDAAGAARPCGRAPAEQGAPLPAGYRAATCPRCGGPFACGAEAGASCFCRTPTLTPALLAQLRARYAGCLCASCLHLLAERPGNDLPA